MARIAAVLLILIALAPPARAQTVPVATTAARPAEPEASDAEDAPLFRCKQQTADVVVTFKSEVELKDLLAWVMGFTCKSFMFDPRIVSTNRKVSMIVPNKLSPREAYRVFLAALGTAGFTIVPRGPVYRVVDATQAKKEALHVQHSAPGDIDQYVRYVYQPSYLAPEVLLAAWSAMKSDQGDVQVVGKLLMVADFGSNVEQMLAVARLADVPGGSEGIYTLPVLHADASKLAEKISNVLSMGGAGPAAGKRPELAAAPSKLVVDDRTNTLIVTGSPAAYQRIKALVERLDIALEIEGGTAIHVYPLTSAIAEELAKTLTQAIGDGRSAAPTTPAQPARPGATPLPAQPPTPPPAAAPQALDNLGTALEGQVKVIADPPTNALIVLSSGRDFFAIRDVIRQLDLPRRQVYIEAMILEVASTDDTTVGTSAHAADVVGNSAGVVLGGVETSDVNTITINNALSAGSLASSTGLLTGLIGTALKNSTTLLGTSIPSFAVLFRAVANQSTTRIVSAPSIIAVDNIEAKYKIGTNVPVTNGSITTGATVGGLAPGSTTTTVDRKDLPLTLDIKPHISDDTVLLEVKHEAFDKTGENNLGPIWSTRSFETRVVVRDQQTVVLGGLTQEKDVVAFAKVPVLGDIPLIGYLFKTRATTHARTNLLVMLTPYIIKDQRELQDIQRRKLREHEEFARSIRALDGFKYEPTIDYGKKRGVIEEINRRVIEAEQETAALTQLPHSHAVPEGSIDAPADHSSGDSVKKNVAP